MKTNSIGKSFTIEKILKIDFQRFHFMKGFKKSPLSSPLESQLKFKNGTVTGNCLLTLIELKKHKKSYFQEIL